MFDAIFTDAEINDYRATLTRNAKTSKRFNALLLQRGIFKSDNKLYVSLAHDESDVKQTLEAFVAAARQLEPASMA